MNDAIQLMMEKYQCKTSEDYENALKEIVQEVALQGLSRSDFFTKAAFYGGTALRIFYGLPRYSEDLDFSLDGPDSEYDLSAYLPYVEKELEAYNFSLRVKVKEKAKESAVQSAFFKGNTVQNILEITSNDSATYGLNPNSLVKIAFEIDTNPPLGAGYQYVYAVSPDIFRVKLYDLPSLFSGKIHAVLCREYNNRVKGRDYFDFIWYLRKGCKVNLKHLQNRLEQSEKWNTEEKLTIDRLKSLLCEKFAAVDFISAKEDVYRFINANDRRNLGLWNADFFSSITNRLLQGE